MIKAIITALIALLLCTSTWAERTKSDLVTLQNGDRITGEIKELLHGKLRVRTSSMGTVQIEWDDVVHIESDYDFRFGRSDGERFIGGIEESEVLNTITIAGEGTKTQPLEIQDVIRIAPIDYSFWDSVRGSMTFGYSFTKASEVGQLNFGFDATHRTDIRSWTIDGSTITTTQETLDDTQGNTQRTNLALSMTRFRANRWFDSYVVGFESNDELGLNLRSRLGAGRGRFLHQSSKAELALLGGLVGTNENLSGEESSKNGIEAMLVAAYSRFQFDDPNVDLSVALAVYPSLTESGRVRAQFDANYRWEIISDLFWELTYYNTYDSDPSGGAKSKNDYAVVTSLGWTF
jgi:hypothetical protein